MFRCSNQSVLCCTRLVKSECAMFRCTASRWKELEIGRKATPKVSEGMSCCTVEHGLRLQYCHMMTSMSSCFQQRRSEKSQIVGLHTHAKINWWTRIDSLISVLWLDTQFTIHWHIPQHISSNLCDGKGLLCTNVEDLSRTGINFLGSQFAKERESCLN